MLKKIIVSGYLKKIIVVRGCVLCYDTHMF